MNTSTQPLPKRQPRPTPAQLRIEVAGPEALPLIHVWAEANAWSPGEHDGTCYLDADPDALHIGFLDTEPVSAVFVANHDAGFAHLGGYMVAPQHRGYGYGLATFQAALRHAGDRIIGLHAVTNQVQNYQQSGFTPTYSTWRFSGTPDRARTMPAGDIVDATQLDLTALVDYDARHFRAPRSRFLHSWISAPGHIARVVLDGETIIGFGVIRPTTDHSRIGPLYARDSTTAAALITELTRAAEAGAVAMDVPEVNQTACDLAGRLGLTVDFEMVTMVTPGPLKPFKHRGVYAVASAELG